LADANERRGWLGSYCLDCGFDGRAVALGFFGSCNGDVKSALGSQEGRMFSRISLAQRFLTFADRPDSLVIRGALTQPSERT
jgi:hypothetical protein